MRRVTLMRAARYNRLVRKGITLFASLLLFAAFSGELGWSAQADIVKPENFKSVEGTFLQRIRKVLVIQTDDGETMNFRVGMRTVFVPDRWPISGERLRIRYHTKVLSHPAIGDYFIGYEVIKVKQTEAAAIPKEAESPAISEEQQVASLPREGERPMVSELKLRDTPKDLGDYDVKRMIENYNFFEKDLNESGDFPNNLVDNGDGTITDRATGLMWQKEGSSSPLYHYKAKKYVSQLNRENFSGYSNWRIPTLEELWSLLEPEKNERGRYINSVFTDNQSKCWSGDPLFRTSIMRQIVNFERGQVDVAVTPTGAAHVNLTLNKRCFVRAVRTMK
jgi:hypothetical protein